MGSSSLCRYLTLNSLIATQKVDVARLGVWDLVVIVAVLPVSFAKSLLPFLWFGTTLLGLRIITVHASLGCNQQLESSPQH